MLFRGLRYVMFFLFAVSGGAALPLTIGVTAPEGGLAAARVWNAVCIQLIKNDGLDVKYRIFEGREALVKSLRDRFIDAALFDPAWAHLLRREVSPLVELEPAAEVAVLLVAGRNSIVYRPEDFSRASFALPGTGDLSANVVVALAMLAAAGVGKEGLKRTIRLETSESVLKGIVYGNVDGGAVPSNVLREREKRFAEFVRVVGESRPLPPPVVVYRSGDEEERFRLFRDALLSLGKTGEGSVLLAAAGFSGFRIPRAPYEDFSAYFEMYESQYGPSQ